MIHVYVTDFGNVVMSKAEMAESGARFYRNGRYRNGYAYMLHHVLTLFTMDEWHEL